MNKLYYLPPLILQTFIWIPTRIFLKTFYFYKVRGLKNLSRLKKIKKQEGVIFAVNHTSELDPILIPASLPFLSRLMPMFYVSMEQKFYSSSGWRQYIYGGNLFRMWGAYTAYVGVKNYDVILRHHIDILNAGKSLCIFPEGQKTKDGNLGEGKAGVVFLSHKTNSPIVPVKIKGLYKPLSQKDQLGRTKLEVIFGEAIYSKDLFDDLNNVGIEDYKKTVKIVMDKIQKL